MEAKATGNESHGDGNVDEGDDNEEIDVGERRGNRLRIVEKMKEGGKSGRTRSNGRNVAAGQRRHEVQCRPILMAQSTRPRPLACFSL